MDKKEVLTNILDRYNQSIISPVNPFTVDNPDALVFNGHSLTGLFIPWVKEQNNPDLLLRRLYISRLTLSKTVSNVLLLIGEEAIKLANNNQINAAFDEVFICEGIQDLLLFLSDNIHVRNFIDPRLKRERMRRFWGTIDFIEKNGIERNEYGENLHGMDFEVQRWSAPDKVRQSRNANFEYPYLTATKRFTKQSFLEGYESLMTYTTMFNYSLSDGVLKTNLITLDTFMFLNVEDLDTFVKNPMNIRTMAFLGYVPGRIGERYDLKGLRRRYFDFMDENKYL